MKEFPILFSSPMVLALLADRKYVTRRLSKQWLKVKAGDRLWVRETLRLPDVGTWEYAADGIPVMVDAESTTEMVVWAHHQERNYCTSIHMPRFASRILLECEEDSRIERLHDLTEEEALLEVVEPFSLTEQEIADLQISDTDPKTKQFWKAMGPGQFPARVEFEVLWAGLHAKNGSRWKDNPEVIRVGRFHRVEAQLSKGEA